MSPIISVSVFHKKSGMMLEDYLSNPDNFGLFDGEICGRFGCKGKMENHDQSNSCTCFYSAPCSYCMNPHVICDTCGYEYKSENNY